MTPPARDERRWTLRFDASDGEWFVVHSEIDGEERDGELAEVVTAEAALAAARPFLGDDQHPDWADYVATNLLDALEQVPDTGDWYGAVREWCRQTRTGRQRPNRAPAAARQVDEATVERAARVFYEQDDPGGWDDLDYESKESRLCAAEFALLAALTVPESEDCRGCGAPAGLPPAGPCADHGTEHARAVPEPEGRSWRERVECTCQPGDGSEVCPREDECMAAWHEDQGAERTAETFIGEHMPDVPEPEEKR